MLDPLTILEVHDLLRGAGLAERGIDLGDVREFVVGHAMADAIYVARAENGDLHGAAFGWPIISAAHYDGSYVEEPAGEIFYCNMLVTDSRKGAKGDEVAATLKRHVQEAWPDIRYFCYHRAKHEDRMKLYALERLDTHG